MTPQAFYGAEYPQLCAAEQQLVALIDCCPVARDREEGEKAVLYCKSRIKTPESMMRNLEKNSLPPTGRAALEHMHDAVGVRRGMCVYGRCIPRRILAVRPTGDPGENGQGLYRDPQTQRLPQLPSDPHADGRAGRVDDRRGAATHDRGRLLGCARASDEI